MQLPKMQLGSRIFVITVASPVTSKSWTATHATSMPNSAWHKQNAMNDWRWSNSTTRWVVGGSSREGFSAMPEVPAKSPRLPLEPMERISEILFGLIMVLTYTCSFSVAGAGREEVRTMLVGALGCNLAWGVIDAVASI